MPDLFSCRDFRAILKKEYEKRSTRAPGYSLRAFARDLEFRPSHLNDIMKGRYGLSREAAAKVAEKLGFKDDESTFFCDLVESEHGRSQVKKDLAKLRLARFTNDPQYNQMSLDAFETIANWYHFAILELTYVKGFVSHPTWIAQALGISREEAEDAVSRLVRLKMLVAVDGHLKASEEVQAVGGTVPSAAVREFHRQILERAQAAMEDQPMAEREFSSSVMAVARKDLEPAKEMIRSFDREFSARFANSKEADEVYCLGIQFFALQAPKAR